MALISRRNPIHTYKQVIWVVMKAAKHGGDICLQAPKAGFCFVLHLLLTWASTAALGLGFCFVLASFADGLAERRSGSDFASFGAFLLMWALRAGSAVVERDTGRIPDRFQTHRNLRSSCQGGPLVIFNLLK